MWRGLLVCWVWICLFCGAGCMVGPDYQRPQTMVQDIDQFQWMPALWNDTRDPQGLQRWWDDFNDPVMSMLVNRALMQNTDLRAAVAGVQEAEALLAQARGGRWFSVDYSGQGSRSRTGFDASFLPDGGFMSFYSTSYNHGLNVSYALDLFGRLRRNERAALNDLMASEATRQALVQTVVAQVILARMTVSIQQQLLAVADGTVQNWTQAVDLIQERYDGGLGSPLDVYFAKQSLETALAQRSELQQGLVIALHALDVLCGQRPGATASLAPSMGQLPSLQRVPIGLPAWLLDRRPDVRAAEYRLRAATERIGVSMAARFPDLSLMAGLGFNSNQYNDLLTWKYRSLSVGGQIAAPIFQGGALKAGVRASEAAARQAAETYCGVVLTAMREVEDALVAEKKIRERIGHLHELVTLAVEAEKLARERYHQGADPMLNVLETERIRRQAENSLIQAQGQLWQTRVNLMLALGGDWLEAGAANETSL